MFLVCTKLMEAQLEVNRRGFIVNWGLVRVNGGTFRVDGGMFRMDVFRVIKGIV